MIVFEIARLDGRDRSNFRCGTEALDRYVAQLVGQDVRRRLTSCFTAVEKATERIVGSYTLSAASVKVADLGQMSIKNLPRYPVLPAVKLGRLAVDREFRGKGLGSGLLSDALRRASLGAGCGLLETMQGPCGGDGDATLAATRDVRGQRLTSGGCRDECAEHFMVQGSPATFDAARSQERPPKGEVRRCPARFALGSGRRGEVRRSGSSKTRPALAMSLPLP